MDRHDVNRVTGQGRGRLAQVVVFLLHLLDEVDELVKSLEATLLVATCPFVQGVEVSLALGAAAHSAHVIQVAGCLVNRPDQVHQGASLGDPA